MDDRRTTTTDAGPLVYYKLTYEPPWTEQHTHTHIRNYANKYCNTGALLLVPWRCVCQDLAVDELRVRGATSLLVRLGRTNCGERNSTQEI